MTYSIPFRCDLSVDQNRYIGEDPVGYKCSEPAKWTDDHYLICDSCKKIMETEGERITFPPREFAGYEYQRRSIEFALKRFGIRSDVDYTSYTGDS